MVILHSHRREVKPGRPPWSRYLFHWSIPAADWWPFTVTFPSFLFSKLPWYRCHGGRFQVRWKLGARDCGTVEFLRTNGQHHNVSSLHSSPRTTLCSQAVDAFGKFALKDEHLTQQKSLALTPPPPFLPVFVWIFQWKHVKYLSPKRCCCWVSPSRTQVGVHVVGTAPQLHRTGAAPHSDDSVVPVRAGAHLLQRGVRDVHRSHDAVRSRREEPDRHLWHLHRCGRDSWWVTREKVVEKDRKCPPQASRGWNKHSYHNTIGSENSRTQKCRGVLLVWLDNALPVHNDQPSRWHIWNAAFDFTRPSFDLSDQEGAFLACWTRAAASGEIQWCCWASSPTMLLFIWFTSTLPATLP